eukprot:gene27384-4688_t
MNTTSRQAQPCTHSYVTTVMVDQDVADKVRRAPLLRPLLRTAAGGLVLGVCIYGVLDVIGEYSTYTILRSNALELAEADEQLKEQIGHPFSLGPWYNSKFGYQGRGMVASTTFQLIGQKQITDVSVRGVRDKDPMPSALYNVGNGRWRVIDCSAMFPIGGGRVKPKSLIPPPPGEAAAFNKEGESDSVVPLEQKKRPWWKVCAMFPVVGGRVKPKSLIPPPPGEAAAFNKEGESDSVVPLEQKKRPGWKVCAMFPVGGGRVKPKSLIPPPPGEAAAFDKEEEKAVVEALVSTVVVLDWSLYGPRASPPLWEAREEKAVVEALVSTVVMLDWSMCGPRASSLLWGSWGCGDVGVFDKEGVANIVVPLELKQRPWWTVCARFPVRGGRVKPNSLIFPPPGEAAAFKKEGDSDSVVPLEQKQRPWWKRQVPCRGRGSQAQEPHPPSTWGSYKSETDTKYKTETDMKYKTETDMKYKTETDMKYKTETEIEEKTAKKHKTEMKSKTESVKTTETETNSDTETGIEPGSLSLGLRRMPFKLNALLFVDM